MPPGGFAPAGYGLVPRVVPAHFFEGGGVAEGKDPRDASQEGRERLQVRIEGQDVHGEGRQGEGRAPGPSDQGVAGSPGQGQEVAAPPTDINAALLEALYRFPLEGDEGSIPTRFVIVAEYLASDGELLLGRATSPGLPSWDRDGLLNAGACEWGPEEDGW